MTVSVTASLLSRRFLLASGATMLVIREEQMQALAEATFAEFRERLFLDVAARRPKQAAALGHALPERLREALELAESRGLVVREHLRTFVECVLVFGPPPWTTSWAAPLDRSDLPTEFAAARFHKAAREALAQEP